MGFDQANKPPVHKDPDRGGDEYANLVLACRYPGVRNDKHASHRGMLDIRARRYPGVVPVVGVRVGVVHAKRCPVHRDPGIGIDTYASLVLVYRYPGMVPVEGAVTMSAPVRSRLGPGWAPVVLPVLAPNWAPVVLPAAAPGLCLVLDPCLNPAMCPVPAPVTLPVSAPVLLPVSAPVLLPV